MKPMTRIRDKVRFPQTHPEPYALTEKQARQEVEKCIRLFSRYRIHLLFDESPPDYRSRYLFILYSFLDIWLPPHPDTLQFWFQYDGTTEEHLTREPQEKARAILTGLLNRAVEGQKADFNRRIRLNGVNNLSEPEFHYLVQRYKDRFHSISGVSISFEKKIFDSGRLRILGSHETRYCFGGCCRNVTGKWELQFIKLEGDWKVVSIDIGGVDFKAVFH